MNKYRDCLATYPPKPPSLRKGRGSVCKRGVKPLSINLFPLSFEGEGDKGGEVNKHSQVHSIDISSHPYGKIVIGL
jgi:hypothetical protein